MQTYSNIQILVTLWHDNSSKIVSKGTHPAWVTIQIFVQKGTKKEIFIANEIQTDQNIQLWHDDSSEIVGRGTHPAWVTSCVSSSALFIPQSFPPGQKQSEERI